MNPTPIYSPNRSLLMRVSFWMVLAIVAIPSLGAQPTHRERQIVVPQVAAQDSLSRQASPNFAVNRLRTKKPRSLISKAAYDEVIEEVPPQLVKRSAVQQASYGCNCGQCTGEPTCGYEEVSCEVGCGAEGCSASGCDGSCDPGCGSEGICQEASCGVEACGAGGCDACGVSSCDGGCGTICGTDHYNFCLPIFRLNWCRFEFFTGVNSFTGPANYANTSATAGQRRTGAGSFGFYEGLNESRSLKRLFGLDLAAQLGARATQSSLAGAEFTNDRRNQVFVTGGLFRRVDFGLQYGLVVDYLNDDWWYHNNLTQLRGELSWNDGCNREFGYQFTAGVGNSSSGTSVINAAGTAFNGTVAFEPTDQHRLFFRGTTSGGGNYYLFGGGTNQGDGLLGASLLSAARRGFAYQGGFAYLIPGGRRSAVNSENESWNISMGIIYRPGGRQACGRYCRPMFDVADNGTFMANRR